MGTPAPTPSAIPIVGGEPGGSLPSCNLKCARWEWDSEFRIKSTKVRTPSKFAILKRSHYNCYNNKKQIEFGSVSVSKQTTLKLQLQTFKIDITEIGSSFKKETAARELKVTANPK